MFCEPLSNVRLALLVLPVDVALAIPAHCVVALEAREAVGAVVGLAAAGVGAGRDVADEALASVEKCTMSHVTIDR